MDDDEMLELLAEALSRAGPDADENPPAHVIEAASAAGCWLRLDYEVAELVRDSGDAAAFAGVRTSHGDLRQLTYCLDGLTIDCELCSGALLGQVVPASGVRLELVRPDGRGRSIDMDIDGRFLLEPSPKGPVALRCTRAGRRTVLTPWFLP